MEVDYLKVENAPNLVRDSKSKAILNTDTNGLKAYQQARNKVMSLDKTVKELETMKSEFEAYKKIIIEMQAQLGKCN